MSSTVTSMSSRYSRRGRAHAIAKASQPVNSSQRRGQKRRLRRSIGGPAIHTTYRDSRVLRTDMQVRYPGDMTEPSVDRAAWAAVVAQLLQAYAKGNQTSFAAMIGVSYKTVARWLSATTGVSEKSVRQVARALMIPPADLLVRVGIYAEGELSAPPAQPVKVDPAIQRILTAEVSPTAKQRMIERLAELRAREVDEVNFWIDQAKGD